MLPQEQELARIRTIVAEMEREFSNHLEGNQGGSTQTESTKKKVQQEKKRKKEEDNQREEDETEEEADVKDGEKVFTSTKTGKQHCQEILKKMEYIKGMPPLLAMMVEQILRCELKRKSSKNVNGIMTRQMRECLIKLYCTLGEIQKQKEGKKQWLLKKNWLWLTSTWKN